MQNRCFVLGWVSLVAGDSAVAKDYVRGADPDQGFLMPVDMREWLPEVHPVWWFVSLVESLDMSAFEKVNRREGLGARRMTRGC